MKAICLASFTKGSQWPSTIPSWKFRGGIQCFFDELVLIHVHQHMLEHGIIADPGDAHEYMHTLRVFLLE